MNLNDLFESLRTENPCWKGYHPVGTKNKNGRTVPNCVPNANEDVAEGVAETVSMNDAVKVLRHYGARHFKTTSNELHFYKNGQPLSVDLIWGDGGERSVSLSQLNSVSRQLKGQGVAEADKHSMLGKIQRGHELKKKVDSTFKDIGNAQKQGDHPSASKAFRKHERYANLERPGTWTKVDEQGVAEGGNVFMPGIQNTPEYKAGFSTGKLPVPHPEGSQEYASYYKGVIDRATPNLQKASLEETQDEKIGGRYDADEFDSMVSRLKKLAGSGPLRTVYDPNTRRYKNVPVAQQPQDKK